GELLGGRDVGALPEAAVIDREHGKSQLLPPVDARDAAREVPACAMQVEDGRGVGPGVGQPPAVELLAVMGEVDPLVLERVAAAVEAPPGLARGAEDELALLFREEGAAADEDGGDEGEEPPGYLASTGTGKSVWRRSVSVSMTSHAAKSTTTMAATTSKAGLRTIFQSAFCQSDPRSGCILPILPIEGFGTSVRRGRSPPPDGLPEGGAMQFQCRHRSTHHPPFGARARSGFVTGHVRSASASGSDRTRLPVRANTALATAGATGGTPGSPTPVGLSPPGTRWTSISGISFIRST